MPVQISVGPPVITINQSSTFMVTDHSGEIDPNSEQGVLFGDTRLVSHYKLFANNQPWTRLSSSPMTYYSARIHLTNQTIPTEEGEIRAGTVGLTISRAVEVDGIHEDYDVANYGLEPIKFNLELDLYADFADLFEVKEHKFVRRGRIDSTWTTSGTTPGNIDVIYVNRDFARRIVFHGLHSDSPGRMVNGRLTWEVALKPGETWRNCHHWSGWGIRTLSANNPAYNPFSYQNGSVWPHDNGIIATGFKKYGFAAEAARVAKDVIEAASRFVSYRMPELYADVERRPGSFPVQYLGANVPQAWAAGSIFHFIHAMLGLEADAPHGRLYVDPTLPEWLPDVTLRGLKVGSGKLDLRFWREGEETRWDVLSSDGNIQVVQRPVTPSPVQTLESTASAGRPPEAEYGSKAA